MLALAACSAPAPTTSVSRIPTIALAPPTTFTASSGGLSTDPSALLPDATAASPDVLPSAATPLVEASATTTPRVSDIPILPEVPEPSPFPSLPHTSDVALGCRLMSTGPVKQVRAILPGEGTMDTVGDDGHRYDIQLVGEGDQREGMVRFDNLRVAVYSFYLNQDVPFALFLDGQPLALESSSKQPEGCRDIAIHHFVEMMPGEVMLHFGPSAQSTVGLVIDRSQEAR